MRLLALDTALDACSVAVLDGERTLAVMSEPMARGHQERLAPMAQAAMAAAGLGFDALDRIVVTIGPGSFTGLRVGLAFAKGLALALERPCVGVGTLEALAASASPGRPAGPVAAAIDAKRGQVYLQPFDAALQPLAEPEPMDIGAAVTRLKALGFAAGSRLTGSGAVLLSPGLPGVDAAPGAGVDVAAMARLALGRPTPEATPQPLYLRAPDAKTIAERAAARA